LLLKDKIAILKHKQQLHTQAQHGSTEHI